MNNIVSSKNISKNNWKKIQNFPLSSLQPIILGKKVEMEADCELFPNFHVIGVVIGIEQKTKNACLIHVRQNKTSIRVDGGMNGLRYRIVF